MINRKLIAALVGLSVAAGTFGTASAETAAPAATSRSASPADATAPDAVGKSRAATATKTPAHRHGRVSAEGASQSSAKKAASVDGHAKPAKHVRVSRAGKRGGSRHG